MEPHFDNILIFGTNIKTENDKQIISRLLNTNPGIEQWNIDLEDIDSVLRIESKTLNATQIIKIITEQDFKCTELTE
jgi:copper chaperone CopZ